MFNKTRTVKRFIRRNKFRALLIVTAVLGVKTVQLQRKLDETDAILQSELAEHHPLDA